MVEAAREGRVAAHVAITALLALPGRGRMHVTPALVALAVRTIDGR